MDTQLTKENGTHKHKRLLEEMRSLMREVAALEIECKCLLNIAHKKQAENKLLKHTNAELRNQVQ